MMIYVAIILSCMSQSDINSCNLSTSEMVYPDKATCETWLAGTLAEPENPIEVGYCAELLTKPKPKKGGGI
jgi:hypothetical protein